MMTEFFIGLLIALTGLLASSDIDGNECYEDEAVVFVISQWDTTGTDNAHTEPVGEFGCVATDDIRVFVP